MVLSLTTGARHRNVSPSGFEWTDVTVQCWSGGGGGGSSGGGGGGAYAYSTYRRSFRVYTTIISVRVEAQAALHGWRWKYNLELRRHRRYLCDRWRRRLSRKGPGLGRSRDWFSRWRRRWRGFLLAAVVVVLPVPADQVGMVDTVRTTTAVMEAPAMGLVALERVRIPDPRAPVVFRVAAAVVLTPTPEGREPMVKS